MKYDVTFFPQWRGKYDMKRNAGQIKRLAPSKSLFVNSDRNNSVKVSIKKEESSGVLPIHNWHGKNSQKHRGD